MEKMIHLVAMETAFYGPITLESGFAGNDKAAKKFFELFKEFEVKLEEDAWDNKILTFTRTIDGLTTSFTTDLIVDIKILKNGYSRFETETGDIYHLWDETKFRINNGTENPIPMLNRYAYKEILERRGEERFIEDIIDIIIPNYSSNKEFVEWVAKSYILYLRNM